MKYNYDNLKNIYNENQKVIKEMSLSLRLFYCPDSESLVDRINFLTEQNKNIGEFLTKYETITKQIEELKNNNSHQNKKEIHYLNNELNREYKNIKKLSQGKFKDILSAGIFQLDKKFHNFIYQNDNLWNLKNKAVQKRYDKPVNYAIKNTGIALAPLIPGIITANPILIGIGSALLSRTAIKTGSTIYDKKNYDKPQLDRQEHIVYGNPIYNFRSSIYKFRKQRQLILDSKNKKENKVSNKIVENVISNKPTNTPDNSEFVISNSENILRQKNIIHELENANTNEISLLSLSLLLNNINNLNIELNEQQQEKVKLLQSRYEFLKKEEKRKMENPAQEKNIEEVIHSLSTKKRHRRSEKYHVELPKVETKKPDINNYANLDQFGILEQEEKSLTFARAISIVRDKNFHSQDEWEMAMKKLACTFGKNKRKKKESKAVLNDFNKTQKLLAEYGRKIKGNNYTAEDKLIYNALMYHLAKYDVINFSFDTLEDDINDFIADEALRYANDCKKYVKTK